jgi:glucose-6-phosphate 1-dehydrogenase
VANIPNSDALVFFGATGDLAYKQIFPALQALVSRHNLKIPIIGVARSGWSLEKLKARARESLEKHGGVDEAAFEQLSALLRYVNGDYNDPTMFTRLRQALDGSRHPLHYLAIPPTAFSTVAEGLAKSGCAENARVVVAALQPMVAEIFAISHFNLVFQVFPGVREALASVSPEAAAAFDKA